MSELTVTLNAIREHSPCFESWQKLLADLGKTKADGTEVSIRHILNLLGLDDALWALRALPESMDNQIRLLVCALVQPAMKYTDDPRPQQAIDTARRFANGEASEDDLAVARAAADAALDAARGAAGAARGAAGAALDAASATALDAARAAWDAASATASADQEEVFKAWLDQVETSEQAA